MEAGLLQRISTGPAPQPWAVVATACYYTGASWPRVPAPYGSGGVAIPGMPRSPPLSGVPHGTKLP
jgi:hypothetical protein